MSPSIGATLGCDFSGVVVAVDQACSRLRIGDRVGGAAAGNNQDEPHNGAFAEYTCASESLLFKLPADMTFETGSVLGCGLLTVGLSLYRVLKLPLPLVQEPVQPCSFVLVHGGGTATGTLAIQALKLSGMMPITTCSPRSFSRVRSLGAVAAWDYNSASCAAEIRAFTSNNLTMALDCITDSESMKTCYAAIGERGGQYVGLDQFPIRGHTRRDIRPDWIIAWTVTGKAINWKKPYYREAKPKDKAFGLIWMPICQKLLDDGHLQAHPITRCAGGLDAVSDGIDLARKGKTGGMKMVYRIADPVCLSE